MLLSYRKPLVNPTRGTKNPADWRVSAGHPEGAVLNLKGNEKASARTCSYSLSDDLASGDPVRYPSGMTRICTFDGCDKKHTARSYCQAHYIQLMSGKPLTVLTRQGGVAHGKPGTYSNQKCRCDPCREAWNAECAKKKRGRVGSSLPESKEHGLETSYQWGCRCLLCKCAHSKYVQEQKYNSGSDTVQRMREEQSGVCACCLKPNPKLVVDHIHGTTHIRGLLCHGCNTGIGKLGDDIEGVQRALDYLTSTLPKG